MDRPYSKSPTSEPYPQVSRYPSIILWAEVGGSRCNLQLGKLLGMHLKGEFVVVEASGK